MSQSIQDALYKEIKQFLTPYLQKFYDHRIENYHGSIKVIGKVKELDYSETMVIKVFILDEEIQIPNIFMPEFMRKQNIGKDLILIIYKIAKEYNSKLYIIDLTLGFYDRLVNRGAIVCVIDDVVQITDDTDLSQQKKYK